MLSDPRVAAQLVGPTSYKGQSLFVALGKSTIFLERVLMLGGRLADSSPPTVYSRTSFSENVDSFFNHILSSKFSFICFGVNKCGDSTKIRKLGCLLSIFGDLFVIRCVYIFGNKIDLTHTHRHTHTHTHTRTWVHPPTQHARSRAHACIHTHTHALLILYLLC